MSAFLTVILVFVALVALAVLGLYAFTAWTAWRVEKVMPPQGRFIDVIGTRLHYLDDGEGPGPDILMIHGLGGQVLNFRHSLMGKLTANHRVVAIDRPGSGFSGVRGDDEESLGEQARTIAAAIETLNMDKPLVVGHSLGGAVALALALDYPQKVGGLALLAPLTQPSDVAPEIFAPLAIRSAGLRKLIAWTVAIPSSIRNATTTLDVVFGPEDVPDDFGTRGGGLLSLRPKSFIAASSNMTNLPDFLPAYHRRYGELKLPVGILFGTGDRVLDWQDHGGSMTGHIDDLVVETIEDAGHMIPVTQAGRSATFIERVASRIPSGKRTAATVAHR